jgi:hypothetical protein
MALDAIRAYRGGSMIVAGEIGEIGESHPRLTSV